MAAAVQTTNNQTVSTLDALWTLIQCQKKSIQKALAKRLNDSIEAEKEAKVKMTEAEFYAKLDASIADAEAGHVIAQREGETVDDFLNRLLCTK